MTEKPGRWSFTQREWQVPVVIWALLSVLAALTGPFETYSLLSPVARLAYWAVVVGVSVGFDLVFRRIMAGQSLLQRLLERVGFALILAGGVHLLNFAVFDGWSGWAAFAYLAGIVLAVTAAVEIAVWVLRPAAVDAVETAPDAPERPDPAAAFLRRLPADKRGDLIRIEAQDHYLNVVTTKGAALILMRMADAEVELAQVPGVRVHRSHWVARDAITATRRRDGRDFLHLRDDTLVPVSRSYRSALRESGAIKS